MDLNKKTEDLLRELEDYLAKSEENLLRMKDELEIINMKNEIREAGIFVSCNEVESGTVKCLEAAMQIIKS